MNPAALALALALCGAHGSDSELQPQALPAPTAPADDQWVAEDKLRHFTMSFALVQIGYGAARTVVDRPHAVRLAAAGALTMGVGKELVDHRAGGPFSLRDLAWDVAGVALGVVLAHRIE